MGDLVPEARLIPVYLEEWGITVPYAQVDGAGPVYVVVRMMCAELGINVDGQLEKLVNEYSDDMPEILADLRVPTGGGRQVTKCLRKAETALWIASITPRRVKKEFRDQLDAIRKAVLLAADRIVFGDHSQTLTVSSSPAKGGRLHVGTCPRCHAELEASISSDGIDLSIIE